MTHLHHLGTHAQHLAHHTKNERMQAILQWVGVGSVILMGTGAAVHLFKDLVRPHPEPYHRHRHREMLDDLDRHYGHDGRGHGR